MKIPKLRWVIVAMLFLATMINYTDRLALSIVSTDLRREFAMGEQEYSYVLAAFLLAYAIGYAASGYVVDRLGTRRGFAAFIFTWSLAAMMHALARGKWSLTALRFALGLGEPGNWPAAAKAVAEWLPPAQRALGVGVFNAGASLGAAIAPPAVAFLTLAFGWRFAFLFTGGWGVLWLALWLVLYQPPHRNRWLRGDEYAGIRSQVSPPEETAPAGRVDFARLVRTRECLTLTLARFFTDPVIYFVIFWLPEYLRRERGFDLAMVGKYAWVPFIFGDVGYFLGGWLSGRLVRAGWSLPAARKAIMLAGALMMPVAMFAPFAAEAWMAIGATCFLTFGHAFWTANIQTLPADLFRGPEIGTVAGFSGMGGAVGGLIANLGTGYLVQRLSYKPVFLLAGLMHPLSIALVYWLLPERWLAARATRAVPETAIRPA